MVVRILAAMVTAVILHHLSLIKGVASITNHTLLLPNISSTGFSFRLVFNNAIRRRDDGFLHLHDPPASLENGTSILDSKVRTLPPPPVSMAVHFGTGAGRKEYILKIDNSEVLTWIQCKPCKPQARQRNPLFDPLASPTFSYVRKNDPLCQPPYGRPTLNLCGFHLTAPTTGMSVTGYLLQDEVSTTTTPKSNFLFGCSYATENFNSENVYAGVISLGRTPASLATQAAARHFSYCLFEGLLRFDTDIVVQPHYRTTRILPKLDAHDSEYHLSLVGVSLEGRKLAGIHQEMFARGEDGKGGCVIDLGTHLTVMVREAYNIIEEAVWSDLQHYRKVERAGFGLCVRATKRRLPSLSLHFSEEEAVLTLSPQQLFLMTRDEQGQIACLAMAPGHRTVIGAFQQVDTRFVYDLKDSKLYFAPESCSQEKE